MLSLLYKLFLSLCIILLTLVIYCYIPLGYLIKQISYTGQIKIVTNIASIWLYLMNLLTSEAYDFQGTNMIEDNRSYMVISNHNNEMDFLSICRLFKGKDGLKNLKFVIKSELKSIPGFYQILDLMGFIPIDRNFAVDKVKIEKHIDKLVSHNVPMNLLIYPEGTVLSDETKLKSNTFRADQRLSPLNNVLSPKSRGFDLIKERLKNSYANKLLDITLYYSGGNYTSFANMIFSTKKKKVQYKMNIMDLMFITDTKAFLENLYIRKDKIIEMMKTNDIAISQPLNVENDPQLALLYN